MRIDWGALLSARQPAATVPTGATMQTHASGTNAGGADGIYAGDDGDREAWEERAAIIEFEGGQDRRTAEALATAEEHKRGQDSARAARAGDDRRTCLECRQYQERRCMIAKPGGLVSAVRGYVPPANILGRCEGFTPLLDDPDQRPGVERWPWLLQPPFRPATHGPMAPRQPAQSPSGRASV